MAPRLSNAEHVAGTDLARRFAWRRIWGCTGMRPDGMMRMKIRFSWSRKEEFGALVSLRIDGLPSSLEDLLRLTSQIVMVSFAVLCSALVGPC